VPRVSAWFVRAALCHLVLGFAVGAALLAHKGGALGFDPWPVRPVHIELLIVGWMIQLVMGVAVWIFPRFVLRRAPRRSATTAWLAFALLNMGVLLASLGGSWLAAGRLSEIAAAASFAVHLWGRVSPAGLSDI
jgi:cbb3-type cytochrome oxidase subunit 1